MLNLKSIMVGSKQLRAMEEFYRKVFDRPADMVEEGNEYGWKVGNTYFLVGEHSDVQRMATEPGRIICNFETKEIHEEFARIRDLGAEVVREPYEMEGLWIATFADPDGNYIQLMTPFETLMGL